MCSRNSIYDASDGSHADIHRYLLQTLSCLCFVLDRNE